jgi:four helix bundle protein
MQIRSATELAVYRQAYQLAMDVFSLSKAWPPEEKYSLTDQIRRASRSVCASLREAWAKRRYEAHFVSKLTDADGENSELETWLDFAQDCKYLPTADAERLRTASQQVGAMLGAMLKNPTPFLSPSWKEKHDQRSEV